MMIYILDTNIFLRTLIKENDQTFADCVKLLGLIKSYQVEAVLPGVVLSEVAWVLKSYYQLPKAKVIQALKSILKLNGLKVVDNYDYEQTIKYYEENNVKYIDCLIASLVKNNKYAVVSYDEDFDKLKISRQEPGDFD
ncbi:MAG: PIN domain-containing protein [Patescibacteria group bacterium]|nr:PIN domain-containing protein [Patescibacteria group bacterium]